MNHVGFVVSTAARSGRVLPAASTSSGMNIDIGGALSSVASPGVSRPALERLDDRVARAHERIHAGRESNDHGYAALNLPEQVDPTAIRAVTDRFETVDAVLVAGIGGSALGAATIGAALDVPIYTLDNVDPAATRAVLAELPLERTVLVAVSRSGTTTETLANFLVARAAFEDAGIDWQDRTLVITGEEGPLATLADRQSLPRLPVPDGVPGRYSVLSSVGLAPAALAGADIEALLAGGREAAATLSDSLFETPGYAYGAVAYALGIRGAAVNAMMPYSESLERFSEWFTQLWAESLGKEGLGQIPTRAVGVTDQHSQLQLYRAGPRQLVISVLGVADQPTVPIPTPEHETLAYLDDTDLSELLATERATTVASLAEAGRPSVELTIDAITPTSIGTLFYTMEAACIMAGELYGVDPFTQPAVEWGKRATRGLLRGEETPETAAVKHRESLVIGSEERRS